MEEIHITIDGNLAKGKKGATILEVAKNNGVEIPTLCHHEELKPAGNCRICMVEVEGMQALAGSCHTPIDDGMVIHSRSKKVLEARRINLQLLLAGHTGPCVTDEGLKECELHRIAADLEVDSPKFQVKEPRFYTVENKSPYIWRDLSKCILCRKCIRACEEIVGQSIFSMAYRGFKSKVVVDCDIPINKVVCKDCGVCIEHCPTSALGWQKGISREEPLTEKGQAELGMDSKDRQQLLPLLQGKQREAGYISEEAIEEIAQLLELPVSEVYGVATFYSFFSTKKQGKHVLRICKSLPCYLKGSAMIIESVQKVIGIRPGEITPDGIYSLELTNCIGACDQAPAMLLDDKLFGNLTSAKIVNILQSHL